MNSYLIGKYIVNWLRDYATNAGVNGFILGVSGGIDSAVTSTLCAQTGLRLICLEIPIHQEPSQVTRARNHIAALQQKYPNVESGIVELTNVYDELAKVLPTHKNEE